MYNPTPAGSERVSTKLACQMDAYIYDPGDALDIGFLPVQPGVLKYLLGNTEQWNIG